MIKHNDQEQLAEGMMFILDYDSKGRVCDGGRHRDRQLEQKAERSRLQLKTPNK